MYPIREGSRVVSTWTALGLFAIAALPWSTAWSQTASPRAAAVPAPRALVDQYCVVCHNQKNATAGVALNGVDFANVGGNAALLERVLRKVRTGEMPPAGMPRPTAPAATAFTKSLEDSLDRAAAAHPNPGRPAVHRLNRAEYSNAIRDVLALDIQPGLCAAGGRFRLRLRQHRRRALAVSPALLERYMSVGPHGQPPGRRQHQYQACGRRYLGAPRRSGRRRPRTQRARQRRSALRFARRLLRSLLLPGGRRIRHPRADSGRVAAVEPRSSEVRQTISAGLRTIGVTFLRESAKPEIGAPARTRGAAAAARPPGGRRVGAHGGTGSAPGWREAQALSSPAGPESAASDRRHDHRGPYNITGPGDTPSRDRIFVCQPGHRARRRTLRPQDPRRRRPPRLPPSRHRRRPQAAAGVLPRAAAPKRDFDFGIEKALRAMLVSPDFLFRIEQDPPGTAPGTVYRISDLELASRLSFFLWSSVPDDTVARSGRKEAS